MILPLSECLRCNHTRLGTTGPHICHECDGRCEGYTLDEIESIVIPKLRATLGLT